MPYKTSNAEKVAAIIPGYPAPAGTRGTFREMITSLEDAALRLDAELATAKALPAKTTTRDEQLAAFLPGYPVPHRASADFPRYVLSLPEVVDAMENTVLRLHGELAEAKKPKAVPVAVVTLPAAQTPAAAKSPAKAKQLFGAERVAAAIAKSMNQ